MRAGRALRQFPFVGEQIREEVVAPLRRRRRPNYFQAAADRVATMTFAELILPPKALILDVGASGSLPTYFSGNASPVGFAERVSAGNERNRFFVVHRHPGERLPNIACRGDGIGLSIRPFRIHIDQAHLRAPRGF